MLNYTLAAKTVGLGLLLLSLSSCTSSVQSLNLPPQPSVLSMIQKPTLSETAQTLRHYEILTEQEYQAVVQQINQGQVLDRSTLLQLLSKQAERRFNPNQPQPGAIIQYRFIGELGETEINRLKTIAQRLKESGAISDRIYQRLQGKIGSEIKVDFQLFSLAAYWMPSDEKLEPDQIRPFLDDLQQLGLITEDNRKKLLIDIDAGKVEDKYAIVHYLENTRIFNLADYSRDPNIYFPHIHRDVAQLLTRVGASSLSQVTFKLQLLNNSDENALISTEVNGKKYEFASYSSAPEPLGAGFLGMIDDEEFVQLFNKILRDQKSPYRVYTLGFFGDFGPDYSRFAVLVLTEKQAKQLQRWVNSYLPIGLEDHSSAFNRDRIDSILNTIEEIGLLSHLTPQQITAGKQKISRQFINSSYELFAAFDNLLIAFDWETGNLENPYQALTQRFAAASRGAFQPTQISNEFDYDKQSAGQSFVVKGVRYSTKLKFDGDWLDPAFIDFLDRAIAKTVSGAKFYRLYDGLSLEGYLFLSNRQRQVLESENLVQLKPEKNQN